jgi:hypothetical protein
VTFSRIKKSSYLIFGSCGYSVFVSYEFDEFWLVK